MTTSHTIPATWWASPDAAAAAVELDLRLAADGFHRIGRIDDVGRRSLWLREEQDALELCAGREGRDARVRITTEHLLYRELDEVLGAARFAAEWEAADGSALAASFAADRHAGSVHRVRDEEDAPADRAVAVEQPVTAAPDPRDARIAELEAALRALVVRIERAGGYASPAEQDALWQAKQVLGGER